MSRYDSYIEFTKLLDSLNSLTPPVTPFMEISTYLKNIQPPTYAFYPTTSEQVFSELVKSLTNNSLSTLSSSIQPIINISESLKHLPQYSDYTSVINSMKTIDSTSSLFSFLSKYKVPIELSYSSNFINSLSNEITNALKTADLDALSLFNTSYIASILPDIEELILSDMEAKPQIMKRIGAKLEVFIERHAHSTKENISIAISIITLINSIYSDHITNEFFRAHELSDRELIMRMEQYERTIDDIEESNNARFSYLRSVSLTQYVNEQNACVYRLPSNDSETLGKLPLGAIVQLAELPQENGYSKIDCWIPATGKFVSGWIDSAMLELSQSE